MVAIGYVPGTDSKSSSAKQAVISEQAAVSPQANSAAQIVFGRGPGFPNSIEGNAYTSDQAFDCEAARGNHIGPGRESECKNDNRWCETDDCDIVNCDGRDQKSGANYNGDNFRRRIVGRRKITIQCWRHRIHLVEFLKTVNQINCGAIRADPYEVNDDSIG